ncbi:MAG TPA: hypothetical protein VHC22_32085 [Pirellulales bacterium]|nr:hypothetical protein [Pirellulales bacterium]
MDLLKRIPYRDWLAFVALAGLSALCGLAVHDAATRPVRFVDRLDHAQLVDWLSTRDVRPEFTSTKLRLARRLAEDLRQGYGWWHDVAALDRTRRVRWDDNLRELVRVWLLERADRYVSLAEPDRTAYVDEQLDDLLYWPVWQNRDTDALAGLLPRNPTLAMQQVDGWMGELRDNERQRIQQFTGALYLRWVQRGFQFLPAGA